MGEHHSEGGDRGGGRGSMNRSTRARVKSSLTLSPSPHHSLLIMHQSTTTTNGSASTCTLIPSEWGATLRPSPTLTMYRRVQELMKQGVKVYDFGIGEMQPEICIPDVMKQAMKDAIDNNQMSSSMLSTYYTSQAGDSSLLQALSADFSRNFGLNYSTKQIVICSGPKDALFKACLALLSPHVHRNRVVTFAPSYPKRLIMFMFEAFENIPYVITGKYPIRLQTDERFCPIVEDLKNLLATDDSIAMIIINSPNNPSGAVYPPSLIARLADVISQHPHIAVLFDEVYRTVCFDDNVFTNIAKFIPQQTVTIGGASKEVAGTGTRIGYAAGPEEIISVITKIHGNTSACVSLPCQRGFAKLLEEDTEMKIRHGIRNKLKEKRDCFTAAVKKNPHLSCISLHTPEGAFYAFPNAEALYGKTRPDGVVIGSSDVSVVQFLIEVAHVATVDGSSFGRKGHIRIAYASKTLKEIEEGVEAIANAVAKLT